MDRQPDIKKDHGRFDDEKRLAQQVQTHHPARRERVPYAKCADLFFESRAFAQPTGRAISKRRY
jgi:hypothetical protein